MKRDPAALAGGEFDLLIIGGGIHGACAAREAALRGLSTALVEQGDYGSGTSANSLKIVHGGLRYLQQADLPRMRASIRERRTFLRLAPHLVQVLPCILPTYGLMMKSLPALGIAMLINDIISADRNAGIPDRSRHISHCRLVGRAECLELLPDVDPKRITGGAIWHDAQMYNAERLAFSFVQAAAEAGAVCANYVEALTLLHDGRRIRGAKVRDRLDDSEFEIRARLVLNCAGASVESLLAASGLAPKIPQFIPSTAMNLVITRPLVPGLAAGLYQRFEHDGYKGSRSFFFTPWRGISVVGTRHLPLAAGPLAREVTEDKIGAFLSDLNQSMPGAKLRRDDVACWNWGIIPMQRLHTRSGEVSLVRHSHVVDHRADGLEGLLSVIGVKYTTGRIVAEHAVKKAAALLAKPVPSRIGAAPLPGGDIADQQALEDEIAAALPYAPAMAPHLAHNYGSRWRRITALASADQSLLRPLPGTGEVCAAEILYNLREESARTLADVVLRRTGLGTVGRPDRDTLDAAAAVIAAELGWSDERRQREIAAVEAHYMPRG